LRGTIRREADALYLYQLPDQKTILHIEIQQQDQQRFSNRNLLYLALLLNQYPDSEALQYVLYTGKKPPAHVGMPLVKSKLSYDYEVIYLAGIPLEEFSGLRGALAYAFAAGVVKDEGELKEFLDKFVEKTGYHETETFNLALLEVEGLLEKTLIQTLNDMIQLKSPKKSKILGAILRREEEARQEGLKEGMEKGEKIKANKTAENCLLEGLDVEKTVKIT
jgi:predicted transposase YdaD